MKDINKKVPDSRKGGEMRMAKAAKKCAEIFSWRYDVRSAGRETGHGEFSISGGTSGS
jgi:hypothetical protein